MSRSVFREMYDGPKAILPELPMVAWKRANQATVPGLKPHSHVKEFEIFFMERGEAEWWVKSELHLVRANHVYVNRPGEIHGSLGHGMRPCGYFWIHLTFPGNGLPGVARDTAAAIRRELLEMRHRSFPGSDQLRQCFEDLILQHRVRAPFQVLRVRARLHLLLASLLSEYRAYAGRRVPSNPGSFAIRKAMDAVASHIHEIKTVSQLARIAGLGVTQFSGRFSMETGFTPATYLRRQRIERAKSLLLQGGHSIAQIAQETGFSSSQHFATVFKQIEGLTPGDFLSRAGSGRRSETRERPERA